MLSVLAWVARNAPAHLQATFFAVMASFTNLTLSASSLGTKYIYAHNSREFGESGSIAALAHCEYFALAVMPGLDKK